MTDHEHSFANDLSLQQIACNMARASDGEAFIGKSIDVGNVAMLLTEDDPRSSAVSSDGSADAEENHQDGADEPAKKKPKRWVNMDGAIASRVRADVAAVSKLESRLNDLKKDSNDILSKLAEAGEAVAEACKLEKSILSNRI